MVTQPFPIFLTEEQYVKIDNGVDGPLEFVDGEVFEIEGASENHGIIQVNLSIAVGTRLRGSSCTAMGQSTRVRVPSGKYFHPDLVVVCGKRYFHEDETLLNPTVVFEILSKSTGDYDLGRKSILYRSIPSLREYIVIDQSRAWVQQWTRESNSRWQGNEVSGLHDTLPITSLGCEIPVGEFYINVECESPDTPPVSPSPL